MANDSKFITDLADRTAAAIKTAIRDAYEAGLRDRDAKIGTELQEAIKGVMDNLHTLMLMEKEKEARSEPLTPTMVRRIGHPGAFATTPKKRAERGSAEPMILAQLRSFQSGATTMELFEALGGKNGPIKYNTIRGTLWRLANESTPPKVKRSGQKWHALLDNGDYWHPRNPGVPDE